MFFSQTIINAQEFNLIRGSNIYQRIFLFYFPLAKIGKYDLFSEVVDGKLRLEISIEQKNINKEPSTPPLFKSNLVFIIKNIPYNETKKFIAEITIKCNYKMLLKKANFVVIKDRNIFIIQGTLDDFNISEITKDPYFKNRLKWKLPLYFDIRLKK